MKVSLTPSLENFVRETVSTGLYNNASEVIHEALQLLRDKEMKKQELIKALDAGYEDVKAGRTTKFTPELVHKIANEVAEKYK